MKRTRLLVVCTLILLWGATRGSGQTVAVDPLQCWWRTSTGAVRVGEPFSVVLTCSVLDTDPVRVVPDQAPLDPTTIQLPPFEVTGGTHYADRRSGDRRFFQYDYRLRLINEDLFGKDAAIPELKLTYRVRSQVNGAPLEGAEKTYVLPPLAVRVLSLVPLGASDIRDATSTTFGDIEATEFRSSVLVATGGVLVGLGLLVAAAALIRTALGRRGERGMAESLATDRDVLRGVRGELARIAKERQVGGWTPGLAARLLTSLRVLSALAASKPAGARRRPTGNFLREGLIEVRTGRLRGATAIVSGYFTPLDVDRALAQEEAADASAIGRPVLEGLRGPLVRLTTGQYGRQSCDDSQLDDAFEAAEHAASLLAREQIWPVRTFRAASQLGQRVWSR